MSNHDEVNLEELFAAARELIRESGGRVVVSISDVLDELSAKFGNGFVVTEDMSRLVWIIEELWRDRHVDRPNSDWIEYAWIEHPEPESRSSDLPSGPDGNRFSAMRAAFESRGAPIAPPSPSAGGDHRGDPDRYSDGSRVWGVWS